MSVKNLKSVVDFIDFPVKVLYARMFPIYIIDLKMFAFSLNPSPIEMDVLSQYSRGTRPEQFAFTERRAFAASSRLILDRKTS